MCTLYIHGMDSAKKSMAGTIHTQSQGFVASVQLTGAQCFISVSPSSYHILFKTACRVILASNNLL